MSIIIKLIEGGVYEGLPRSEVKKIRLLNIICLNWCAVIIVFIFIDFYIHTTEDLIKVAATHVLQFGMLITVHLLQRRRKYTLARTLFMMGFLIQCVAFCNFLIVGQYIEYWYILLPLFALLFINDRRQHFFYLAIAIFGLILPATFLKSTYPEGAFPNPAIISVLFVVIFLVVDHFKRSNLKSESNLEQQRNLALKDKVLIESQKQELQKLNDFQNQFFINVAHEIRTPLTILKGNTYKLEKSVAAPSTDQRDTFVVLKKQTGKIQRIVDDILDLTRMESDSFELKKEKIQLSDFVAKNFLTFSSNFESKQIDYQLKDLKKGQSALLDGDATYLERAFNNLLSNALKYTNTGGEVTVTVDESEGQVIWKVEDTGLGIKEEDLAKIFNRFYQAENSINRSGGSGIGLAFTREVILMHGGDVTVESQLGIGSVFKVILPVSLVSYGVLETIDMTVDIVEKDKQTVANEGKLKVLLVEDQADMRQYVKGVLSPYEVLEAENGMVALEILSRETVRFIVTDYMMPNMDGHELVKELKGKQIDIPILLLTARSDQEAKTRMLRLGVDDYLTKPFEEEELLIRIENGLKRHEKWKEYLTVEQIPKIESRQSLFIGELEAFTERNCASQFFGIPEISEHFALSVSSLYRRVKSTTGMNPKAFITEVKLQKARKIVEEGKTNSLKEIAADVGFTNYSYFQNLYRERFGTDLSKIFSYKAL